MTAKLTWLACGLVAIAMIVLVFPDGVIALAVSGMLSILLLAVLRRGTEEKVFISNIFLAALAARLAFGIFVHIFDLREFFGGDANTYDLLGSQIADQWIYGVAKDDTMLQWATSSNNSGWGMDYIVAVIYYCFGRNIFLAQSVCAVFGAATAPMTYFCARDIFKNGKVARFCAIAVALFPAFIIWSGQLLKDGLIVFLLVLMMTMVLHLQERFDYVAVVLLVLSLFGIMSLRFYIFYMAIVAVVGTFFIGASNSIKSILGRTVALVILGLGLTYFGVVRDASRNYEVYGNLQRIQESRQNLATVAASGFGADVDVSTTEGAISAIPVGFAYLMFAPFPWQVSSFRQAIPLPEVLVWWAMMPLMISGLWYALRHRFRTAFPIVVFSMMLTVAYSIYQGNVGTAYRQRTQIQVFLFMFAGVGWILRQEKKENEQLIRSARRHEILAANLARSSGGIKG